jgi:ring-1,2-phenylacetyl-CoA epoxidase subunit PaaC
LKVPSATYMQRGGREGRHTEHLGHMLAEMQIVARSHPEATW